MSTPTDQAVVEAVFEEGEECRECQFCNSYTEMHGFKHGGGEQIRMCDILETQSVEWEYCPGFFNKRKEMTSDN